MIDSCLAKRARDLAVSVGDRVSAITDSWRIESDGKVVVLCTNDASWFSREARIALPVSVSALAVGQDPEIVKVVWVDALGFRFLTNVITIQSLEA